MKKRKDGRYAKSVTVGLKNGRPIRKTVYGKTLKELDENYRKLMDEVQHGGLNEDICLMDLIGAYLRAERYPSLKPQSRYILDSTAKAAEKHFGNPKVKDLTMRNIEEVRLEFIEEGHPARFNQVLGILKQAMAYGVTHEILSKNIAQGIKPAKTTPKKRKALTAEEKAAYAAADLNPIERAYVDMLLYTGMRRGEILALRKRDIHLSKGYISVFQTVVFAIGGSVIESSTKTQAGTRRVPITDALRPTLEKYLKHFSPDDLLFGVNSCTISQRQYATMWRSIMVKTFGEDYPPITAHVFRHTFASDLYRAGVPVKAAQLILGHEDVSTTLDTYTHMTYDDIDLNVINTYFCGQPAVKQTKNPVSMRIVGESI